MSRFVTMIQILSTPNPPLRNNFSTNEFNLESNGKSAYSSKGNRERIIDASKIYLQCTNVSTNLSTNSNSSANFKQNCGF